VRAACVTPPASHVLAWFDPPKMLSGPKNSVHAGIRSNKYFLCWAPRKMVCFDELCAPNTSDKQAKVCVVTLEGLATELYSHNSKANFGQIVLYTIREHPIYRSSRVSDIVYL
jgi:hypothetical protein